MWFYLLIVHRDCGVFFTTIPIYNSDYNSFDLRISSIKRIKEKKIMPLECSPEVATLRKQYQKKFER